MIIYDEGKTGICFALALKGSVFPRAFKWAVACGVLSVIIQKTLPLYGTASMNEGSKAAAEGSILSGFNFILGFLIVFRANNAYSRWWEGGTLLQELRGEWFNAFSSLLAFCNSAPHKRDEVEKFKQQLVRLMSLLYGSALSQVSTLGKDAFEFIDLDGFDLESFEFMLEAHDPCEITLQWIQRLIVEANTSDVIKIAPPILSRVYNQLGNGIVRLNNVRKIREFPIPFALAQMITIMLLFNWVTTAVSCAVGVDSPYLAFEFSFIISIAFWGINLIAIELEQPFGDDPNDLPLADMQVDLNKSLCALLHPCASGPSYRFDKGRELSRTSGLHNHLERMRTQPLPQQSTQEQALHEHTSLQQASTNRPHTDTPERYQDYITTGSCTEGSATEGSASDSHYSDHRQVTLSLGPVSPHAGDRYSDHRPKDNRQVGNPMHLGVLVESGESFATPTESKSKPNATPGRENQKVVNLENL